VGVRQTSIDSFREFDGNRYLQPVLNIVQAAGEDGVIWADIEVRIPAPHGALNPRILELEELGLVFRNGDRRKNQRTGKSQLVIRDIKYATPPLVEGQKPQKKTGFAAGLQYAQKLLSDAADFAAGMTLLQNEINKQLKGT
jgi:hypothetical protein